MNCTLEEYLADVKSQLTCNGTYEERLLFVSYDYTEFQIDSNIDYFKDCLTQGLSAYKALLFFNDYLNEEKDE